MMIFEKPHTIHNKKSCAPMECGFSVLEVILAVALFSIFSTVAISFMLQSLQVQSQAQQLEAASAYAEDGLEKVRAIKDTSFNDLSDGGSFGLQFANGKWELYGEYDQLDIYKRIITIKPVKRSAGGDVVMENGVDDFDMKKITADVSWKNKTGETVSTELITYLSRWK